LCSTKQSPTYIPWSIEQISNLNFTGVVLYRSYLRCAKGRLLRRSAPRNDKPIVIAESPLFFRECQRYVQAVAIPSSRPLPSVIARERSMRPKQSPSDIETQQTYFTLTRSLSKILLKQIFPTRINAANQIKFLLLGPTFFVSRAQ
jgi:hypothetical protein